MHNFKPLGILIPRYLLGTLKNGILLLYSSPSYLEIRELMRRDDPNAYNRLLAEVAKGKSPNSEVVRYRDADGNIRNTTNVGAGYVSGTDPVGSYVVLTVASAKPLQWIGKSISWSLGNLPGFLKMITHPTWLKIYHGTRKKFTWQEAKPYSKSNIGLHVSPNRKIAKSFAGNNGYVMEGYAPKPKIEAIDVISNDYNWINNNFRFEARPQSSGYYYDIVFPDTKRLEMLKQAGANPTTPIIAKSRVKGNIRHLNTEKTVNLNLRELLKLPKKANKEADAIILKSLLGIKKDTEMLNKETIDLLRKYKIKSIRYHNNINAETGGESWILTEPWKVWNPSYPNIKLLYLSPIIPLTHD